MKTCPDCGREISSSARVCPHCGKTFTTLGGIVLAILLALVLAALFGLLR